jgi:hypothetical protein
MSSISRRAFIVGLALANAVAFAASNSSLAAPADPLPSWRAGPAKTAIVTYIDRVTGPGPDFVPPAERIAVFDNDGTLWAEQPIYFQFAFAMERIGQMVAKDPTLREKPAFAAIADRDQAAMAKLNEKELMEAVLAVQAGLTTSEYQAVAKAWLDQARHPRSSHALYGPDLQAAVGAAGLSAGGGFQDLHRLGRRGAVHADLRRTGLRRAARAGDRHQPDHQVRDAGRQGSWWRNPRWAVSTTDRASPATSTCISAARLSWRWAIPTATCRCCSTPPPAPVPTCRSWSTTTTRSASTPTTGGRRSASWTRPWTRPLARGWTVVSMKGDWKTIFAAKAMRPGVETSHEG